MPKYGSGLVVVITGAAGYLGRVATRRFGELGWRVVGLDKAFEADDATMVTVDLRDRSAVVAAVQNAVAEHGRIDVLCNVAGAFAYGEPVHETSDETLDAMLDVNVRTLVNTVAAVAPYMIAAGTGKIVNVAAGAAFSGKPLMGSYIASKAAVIRLTESISQELRGAGINANCVCPSIIDTPVNRAALPGADTSKWVSPDALLDVMLFLSSSASDAVHGAAIPVGGVA